MIPAARRENEKPAVLRSPRFPFAATYLPFQTRLNYAFRDRYSKILITERIQ
jgi:hypothetical protein